MWAGIWAITWRLPESSMESFQTRLWSALSWSEAASILHYFHSGAVARRECCFLTGFKKGALVTLVSSDVCCSQRILGPIDFEIFSGKHWKSQPNEFGHSRRWIQIGVHTHLPSPPPLSCHSCPCCLRQSSCSVLWSTLIVFSPSSSLPVLFHFSIYARFFHLKLLSFFILLHN